MCPFESGGAHKENVMSHKLYILVRGDLPEGLQIPQSCHALRAFIEDHPEEDREWFGGSNNIVVLNPGDEEDLLRYLARAEARGLKTALFREPDLDDQATAIAIYGLDAHRLVSCLPKALRPPKAA